MFDHLVRLHFASVISDQHEILRRDPGQALPQGIDCDGRITCELIPSQSAWLSIVRMDDGNAE